jgi:hypothetical protein
VPVEPLQGVQHGRRGDHLVVGVPDGETPGEPDVELHQGDLAGVVDDEARGHVGGPQRGAALEDDGAAVPEEAALVEEQEPQRQVAADRVPQQVDARLGMDPAARQGG